MSEKIELTFTLPGNLLASVTVDGLKEVFGIASILQQLPTVCPFDGQPTRFAYSEDKEKNQYYGVCSSANEAFKFKLGQKKGEGKVLYPVGWSYYETINNSRFTWHWVSGEWRAYRKDQGEWKVIFADTRSKLFPKLPRIDPLSVVREYDQQDEEQGQPADPKPAREVLEASIERIFGDTDYGVALGTPWLLAQWSGKNTDNPRNKIDTFSDEELVKIDKNLMDYEKIVKNRFEVWVEAERKAAAQAQSQAPAQAGNLTLDDIPFDDNEEDIPY